MTDRLYYTNAELTAFDARVVERSDDGHRIYLDKTAFYPTSGGQPHDTGELGGIAVTDVIDEDARVAHVLAQPLPAGLSEVTGTVHWNRRFDFMQQHTGQHLLSALLEDRYGWPTVSVHFGNDSATLDVTAPDFTLARLVEAEREANALVVQNRDVSVTFEDAPSAEKLRKASDRNGILRIVNIAGLDRSACGGTHVKRTGEIGAILLRRAEKAKGAMRIEFLCGYRAVAAARRDADLLNRTAQIFTAAVDDLPRLVETQQLQMKELERESRRMRTELATFEARGYWDLAEAGSDGIRRIHVPLHSGAVKEREALAQAIVALGHAIVVITSASPVGVLLATSADTNIDAGQLIRAVVTPLGGRGGGSPRLAQATLPDAQQLSAVRAALGVVQ